MQSLLGSSLKYRTELNFTLCTNWVILSQLSHSSSSIPKYLHMFQAQHKCKTLSGKYLNYVRAFFRSSRNNFINICAACSLHFVCRPTVLALRQQLACTHKHTLACSRSGDSLCHRQACAWCRDETRLAGCLWPAVAAATQPALLAAAAGLMNW